MKKTKMLLIALSATALVSCKTAVHISETHPGKNKSITKEIPEDPAYNSVIAPYKTRLEGEMNTKISHTATDLDKRGDNSSLGNLLADFTLQGANEWAQKNHLPNADAAVINIGGIRTTIGKGDILTKSIYEVMPFENELVLVELSGKDLQELFQYYAKTTKNNPVAGLLIETDGGKTVQTLINGENPDPDKKYIIATSDYLALGGDNMAFFGKGKLISTGLKLRDVFLQKFKENPEITAKTDTRLIFKNKKAENE